MSSNSQDSNRVLNCRLTPPTIEKKTCFFNTVANAAITIADQLTSYDLLTGLGRLEQAEEYLMQANWTVLKTPECSNAIKSRLYRNLGLLYAAKGNYEEALHQLADDVRVNASRCLILVFLVPLVVKYGLNERFATDI